MNRYRRPWSRLGAEKMQAEIDHLSDSGQVVASDNGDNGPVWYAVWSSKRSVAYAVDAHEDELIPFERSLRSAGDEFAGPFDSPQEAHNFAVKKLIAGAKGRRSA